MARPINSVTTATFSNNFASNLLQQDAQAIVGSGDSFGRLITHLNLDHTDGSGSGINTSYQNDTDTVQGEYHIDFEYSVNGSIGYQRIHYDRSATSLGYNNEGLTWDLGFKAAPSETTNLAVSYGKQEGSYNANVQLNYDLAERTVITAFYTVAVQNQLQTAFNNLPAFSLTTQFGQTRSSKPNRAFPVTLPTRPFGAAERTQFRDKKRRLTSRSRGSSRALPLRSPDTTKRRATARRRHRERRVFLGFPRRPIRRSCRPALQMGASISPATTTIVSLTSSLLNTFASLPSDTRFISADATLNFQINETITANVVYSLFRRLSNVAGEAELTNEILIGIRKSF